MFKFWLFFSPGPDRQPGDVCHGVCLGGALPLVWAKAVPGAPPPREMRKKLPGEQEANQQQNGNKYSFREINLKI